MRPRLKGLSFERQLFFVVLVASLPSFILLLVCLRWLNFSFAATTLVGLLILGKILLLAHYCKRRFSYQLRTLSSLLEAVVNGDFSLRGRVLSSSINSRTNPPAADALSELVQQVNLLADALMTQRLEAKERQLLLGKVVNNIDIALVAVDEYGKLTQVNVAFCKLFNQQTEALLNKNVDQLALRELLSADPNQPIDWRFPSRSGRFSVHRDQFIENGNKHQLLLIKDVKLLLRFEEQSAWHRLIRVIGHEINNSLTPISSLSVSLHKLVDKPEKADILKQSLSIIHERALGLKKLISGYKEMSRQAKPVLQDVDVEALVESMSALYSDVAMEIRSSHVPLRVSADKNQLEQVLINVIKNAIESHCLAYETELTKDHPPIVIDLGFSENTLTLTVLDRGLGISNPNNLFVPFYTTKERGSGIGLAVSRQIIEAHGGELVLDNRDDTRGCRVEIQLPLLLAQAPELCLD